MTDCYCHLLLVFRLICIMCDVSTQGIDEHMRNEHYSYYSCSIADQNKMWSKHNSFCFFVFSKQNGTYCRLDTFRIMTKWGRGRRREGSFQALIMCANMFSWTDLFAHVFSYLKLFLVVFKHVFSYLKLFLVVFKPGGGGLQVEIEMFFSLFKFHHSWSVI